MSGFWSPGINVPATDARRVGADVPARGVTSKGGKRLGSLSIWHWLILLIILAIIVGAVVGFVVLIVRLTKPKSVNPSGVPGVPTATAPGWYPDPNDSSLVRYFDGRVWTSSTQPSG
jgi:hypothetical protein